MRKALVGLLIFIGGAVAGGALVAHLSARASRLHLAMLRVSLAGEERDQASAAWTRGDTSDALLHSACAVVAERGPATLAPERSVWDLTFPMMGAFVADRPCWGVCDFTMLEAQARARLAVVWTRLGQPDEADRQLVEVVRLTGKSDKANWLQVGRVLLDAPAASSTPTPQ